MAVKYVPYFKDTISEIKIYEIMNELKDYRIPDDYDEEAEEKIENTVDNENNEANQ